MANIQYKIKFLVDQVTGQVVWLTTYYDSLPIPIFDQSLNIQKFRGASDLDLWNGYLKYALFYDAPTSKFFLTDSYTQDFKNQFDNIQLLRTKAIALDHINSGITFQYEKYNMAYTGLHTVARAGNLEQEKWLEFLQDEHNCSRDDAIKLINFKKEEWNNIEFMLETTRYRAYNKIKAANTFDEVVDLFECFCAKIFYSGRPSLSSIVALKKPF
jgi:hypothetical protein